MISPPELIQHVMHAYGVENANQLAPLIGISAPQIRGWMRGTHPGYEHTMNLLELAGFLDIPGAAERRNRQGSPSLDLMERLEAVVRVLASEQREMEREELLEAAAQADGLGSRLHRMADMLRAAGRESG